MAEPAETRELTEREEELWEKRIFPYDITAKELGIDEGHMRERGADFRTSSDLTYRIYGYGHPYAVISKGRRLDTLTDDEVSHITFNMRQYRLKNGKS